MGGAILACFTVQRIGLSILPLLTKYMKVVAGELEEDGSNVKLLKLHNMYPI